MWNPKYDTNEPIYETETQTKRRDWGLPRVGDWQRNAGGWG